jgi:hypothetical protein
MGPPGYILDHHAFCPAHYFSHLASDGTLSMDGCPKAARPRFGFGRATINQPYTQPVKVHPREFVFTSCTFDVQGYQTNLLFMPEKRKLSRFKPPARKKKPFNGAFASICVRALRFLCSAPPHRTAHATRSARSSDD